MYKERLQRVLSKMKENNLKQVLVLDPESIWYLTGYQNEPMERFYALYLRDDGNHIMFLNKLFPAPDTDLQCLWFSDTDDYIGLLASKVDGDETLGVDKEMRARFLVPLMKLCPGCDIVLASDCVDDVRACKDDGEREYIGKLSSIDDKVMQAAEGFIKEGVTEAEVAQMILDEYKKYGHDSDIILPSVAFGPNAADPHHKTDSTVIKEGDCVLIDTGSKKKLYASDMTRTFFYKKAGDKQREVYETVRRANEIAEKMVKPGVKLCDLDKAARDHITNAGYGEYFTHRLGHFIGLNVHEKGDVSSASEIIAQPGMIFSIEPGVYIPDEFGVRIEDIVLVTEDGCKILNSYTKELKVLG